MIEILRDSPWPGLIIWVLLYISDYSFTIVCARHYRAQTKIAFEGSFELTPMFQADIDALKRVSPKFVLMMCLYSLLLWWVWYETSQPHELPEAYHFVLGGLILLEMAVHMRHLRNWFLFTRVLRAGDVQGHLEYPRGVILRASGFEMWTFAGFFLALFLVTTSWFILGGAVTCALTGAKHARLAERHARSKAPAA